jgi:hypothetical protein
MSETNPPRVQHVNVKIFARQADINLAEVTPVFHRWIQDHVCEEVLIDVADYRHVPDGPGVMLIAHEANYSLDLAEGRLGLLYNRKAAVEGDAQAVLRQAFVAALAACSRLEEEVPFQGKLQFDAGDCEVILNDRLLAPNTEETWRALRPEVERFFSAVYGRGAFELERRGEPRDLFRVGVKATTSVDLASALEAAQRI